MDKVRLDKWLWAARFFKTRSLAKKAIDSGKVYCDGQRVKPSKDITVHALLKIRQRYDETEIKVVALSDQRRGAPEAALLYRETEASINKRAANDAQRQIVKGIAAGDTDGRPNKKQRRQIYRLKNLLSDNDEWTA